MNNNAIALIILLSLLAACAPAPPPPLPPPPETPAACKTGPAPNRCNPGQPDHVTITPGKVEAAPPNYCVAAGKTVVFRVAGKPKKASVATIPAPQNGSKLWLVGSNSANPREFSIEVPADETPNGYKYLVLFANGDCLDPMITVTP